MRTPYREEPCSRALNRVSSPSFGFSWTLNPYVGCVHRCTFCYVRGFERRAGRPSDDRYGSTIRVKSNIVEMLRRELARRSWVRDLVAVGTATDPYQPAEGRYRLTRGCIRALAAARTPVNLITRGPLVVRDLDVLQHASSRATVSVSVSIPTLDPAVWRTTEPGTAPPRQRLRAIRTIVDGGIACGVSIAPILPGLSDDPAKLEDVVRAARDAGATSLWCSPLNLRPGTREHFLEYLARDWPEQLPRYLALYRKPYLAPADAAPLVQSVHNLREQHALGDRLVFRSEPEPSPSQGRLL